MSYKCVGGCMNDEIHESSENEAIMGMFFAVCPETGKVHQYSLCDQKNVWEFVGELELPK